MARGLNKVMIIGNLGNDPEIKYSNTGTAIANFNIATTENRKDSEGNWEEKTEWHRIVMFGKQAEVCKDYLHKGSKVYIEGRLQTRSWEDQSGQKRYMTEIVGANMVMLDSRGQAPPLDAAPGQGERAPEQNDEFPKGEDDLPF